MVQSAYQLCTDKNSEYVWGCMMATVAADQFATKGSKFNDSRKCTGCLCELYNLTSEECRMENFRDGVQPPPKK